MVNKKFTITWCSIYCCTELVLTFNDVNEFIGALRTISRDDALTLLDIKVW